MYYVFITFCNVVTKKPCASYFFFCKSNHALPVNSKDKYCLRLFKEIKIFSVLNERALHKTTTA